jgi:hypothetical protein
MELIQSSKQRKREAPKSVEKPPKPQKAPQLEQLSDSDIDDHYLDELESRLDAKIGNRAPDFENQLFLNSPHSSI